MKAAEYPHEMWCPSIDVCAICADSECDGIGCISDLDPNDPDQQPHLEQLQAWVRFGRIQEQANAFLAVVENRSWRHDHNPLNADFHGGICPACEEADTERLPADPVIAWVGDVAVIHGERDDSEMCLCGAPDYLTCPDWIAGNGTVSSLTFTSATCGYSLGHRNRHQCDCVCVRPAGHDGPHQCSAEAVQP